MPSHDLREPLCNPGCQEYVNVSLNNEMIITVTFGKTKNKKGALRDKKYNMVDDISRDEAVKRMREHYKHDKEQMKEGKS